jgi:hypothetical protein
MKTYKVIATQLVYFTVLVEAKDEKHLDELVAKIYPDDCYEHPEIDWQIDAISEADAKDIDYFPFFKEN